MRCRRETKGINIESKEGQCLSAHNAIIYVKSYGIKEILEITSECNKIYEYKNNKYSIEFPCASNKELENWI